MSFQKQSTLETCNDMFRKRLSEMKEDNDHLIHQNIKYSSDKVEITELDVLNDRIQRLEQNLVSSESQKQHLMRKCENYIDQTLDLKEQLILQQQMNKQLVEEITQYRQLLQKQGSGK